MKIYIAGAIGKLPESEFIPKFACAAHGLWLLNFKVINPVTLPHEHDRSWKAYMREDLNALKGCEAIFMLNCWEESRGARIENWFAKRYNKLIIYQPKN